MPFAHLSPVEQAFEQLLVRSTLIASSTVLVFDLLLTIDAEIAYVWSNPWSISSMLFFINRYIPFIDTFLSLALKFSSKTNEKCLAYYTVVTWLIVLGTIFSQVILMLRTYAIWERQRKMLFTLAFLLFIVLVPGIILTSIEIKSLKYARHHPGCLLVRASAVILVAYILLVVSETILVVFTIIKAYQHLRDCQSGWVLKLYKDGILFYFIILGISLANIIVPFVAPLVFANWLATPQRVIHSILCNHVLFLIFRQRSHASMTNTLRAPGETTGYRSFMENENETSMNMTIVRPSSTRSSLFSDGGWDGSELRLDLRSAVPGVTRLADEEAAAAAEGTYKTGRTSTDGDVVVDGLGDNDIPPSS